MTYDEALGELHPGYRKTLDEIDAVLFTGDAFCKAENRIALRTVMARWERRLTELSDAKLEDAPLVGCNDFVLGHIVEDRGNLRDEIAMRALQGVIAYGGLSSIEGYQLYESRQAYAYADAMVKAREGA